MFRDAASKSESKNKAPVMKRFIIFSLSLFLIIFIGGSITFIFSMRQIIKQNKGNELSRMLEIERTKLEASVNNEIAIALKMASSPLVKLYFASPDNPELGKLAFAEINAYRAAFKNNSIFWVNDIDKLFHSDDNEPYVVDPNNPDNYWYNMSLYETEVYNFNINYNPDIQVTNLWINAPVFDGEHKPIGIVGTGINLSMFIDAIYKNYTGNVELYFFNAAGEITGAKNVGLVVAKKNIEQEFSGIIANAKGINPGETKVLNIPQGSMAIGTVPLLEWYSVAVMPYSIADYNTAMTALFLVVLVVVVLIFVIFNVFIFRFLKSLRRTMESLNYAKNEAEEANKSKSNFLATMSHEIRTPMNAIIGIAQIQLQKNKLTDEYSTAFEKIHSSGSSLLGIINDILDMSKIETGKMELNPAEYDTPSLINDAVQLNVVRIGSKPIEFKLDIDKNLPSRFFGDELRLKQVLNNLLSNAIKYTGKGQVKLSVDYFLDGEDIMLRFVVEDTGQGMKNEDRERLFSEYLRFNAEANRTTEGAGLGLNITKKLVDMMGGTIAVESEYGKGSKFTVTAKQRTVECRAIGAELAERLRNFTFTSERQTAQQFTLEPMPYGSVLVVDDVETNLYVAEGLLSPYQLKIETADSGFAAIEKVQSGKTYDIIFMDHMMPKMDGIETTEKLRQLGYKGVIVALTANALAGNDEIFSRHGFDGFVSKPIDIRHLNVVLKKFVRDRHFGETGEYVSQVEPEPPKTVSQTITAEKKPKPENGENVEKDNPAAIGISEHTRDDRPVMLIKKLIKKLLEKYRAFFDLRDEESVRETFGGELNYEFSKLFFILFVTIVAWLPYIPMDLQMHQYPKFVVSMRLGLTFISVVLILLRFTKKFKMRPDLSLMILMNYLLLGTSLITATSGEYAASYIGGFTFIMMVPMFAPLELKYKITASSLSLAVFFLAGSLAEMQFSDLHIRYSLNDLITAFIISTLLSFGQNTLRHTAWSQRQKLKKAIEENEKNLTTISNLASKAEASDRAKSNFLASMSHEIRTPMNAIIGIAQIELQKNGLQKEYATALDKIYSSGNNLLGIINDILDMSKIETGKLELNPVEYDIPSLINDAVQLNMVRIGSKQLEFLLDINEKLPSRFFGDELRLKQILNNLLSNAIKYTKKGTVKLSADHLLNGENVTLRFIVEDTGQGMKGEDMERLFSEYLRFNAEANRTTEGTGLGLNITKKLVEMMGGTIAVESEYGKGSKFTVTVRQEAIECQAIGAELAEKLRNFTFTGERQAAQLKFTLEPMPYGNVLVVDDVETNLYVAEGLLSPYELKIETANSGFAAIEKIEGGKTYDIIFMDHMMPKMDGIEATEKIRQLGYNGVIVALTANALAGNDEMFARHGFDGFVSKPIDIRHLNVVLNKFVRDRHFEETKKYKPQEATTAAQTTAMPQSETRAKLLRIFRRDAEKAVIALRESAASGDLKSFTTTAHAMKSALANVGEAKKSQAAAALEKAGNSGDREFIAANTEAFIETLETLAKNFAATETVGMKNEGIDEDAAYLTEQLQIVKTACENYDDAAAYAALDRLKEKQWRPQIAAAIEEIYDMLFLHSDFDGAAERVGAIAEYAVKLTAKRILPPHINTSG